MHPTQHSTISRRTKVLSAVLTEAVSGLQLLAFKKAQAEMRSLNLEPPHAALLRQAARQSAAFRVRPAKTSTGEAA